MLSKVDFREADLHAKPAVISDGKSHRSHVA